nr:UDP-N-acetylglucosamine 2-epimerase (non-hydrolyzing) [uncultured Dyadobacter sp.]
MKKLLSIIGARPQIIKAAAMTRAVRTTFSDQMQEVIVHTGQHYDANMSSLFFEELQIAQPSYNLGVGSGEHGVQTGKMIMGIEEIVKQEKPDYLILYGDTNSTLAGAIAGSKIHVPIVHIEAGLRSFNKTMPEEINRILSDHVSTYLFPPTQTGYDNLIREGFNVNSVAPYTIDNPGIFNVGDVMYDNTMFFTEVAKKKASVLEKYNLTPGDFLLATLHRNANTDDPLRLNAIFEALSEMTRMYGIRIICPVHPRTSKQMDVLLKPGLLREIRNNPFFLMVPPVSFLEIIQLEQEARLIITDSGGVQKEAYFLNKPCIIMRSETEWTEIVESGAAVLCDAGKSKMLSAYEYFENKPDISYRKIYGDGHAAEKMLGILNANHSD